MTPGFGDVMIASVTRIDLRVPFACTLSNLRVRQNLPNGNGMNLTYTITKNGALTALAVTMASTASDGSDLVNSVAFAAGELVDIQINKAADISHSPNDIVASVEVTA
jgi:hypothetical protein